MRKFIFGFICGAAFVLSAGWTLCELIEAFDGADDV